MPACILYCERCGIQETRPLQAREFGVLLAEGAVELSCGHCHQATPWKLVLPPRPPPRPRRSSRPRSLLVIDDDRNTLRILQLMLRSEEYSVQTALSADEAIHRLQSSNFDVLVCDIRMPGFDGRSLFRFLVAYLPHYTAKVVFLTGDHSEKTLRFLQECGCPYTFKPIDRQELQSRIREIG